MDTTLETLFRLALSTSGRRLLALRQVRAIATDYGLSELIQHIDAALVGERATRALDNRWDSTRNKVIYADDVSAIDNWVDQLLTSIRDQAQGYVKDVLRGTALYDHAEHFLAEAFPNGLQALTSLPYVEQVAAVEVLLGDLLGKLAADVSALNLGALIQRLAELSAEYRAAVDKGRDDLTFAEVQTMRKRGQRNLLEIVAMIVGTYHSHTNSLHNERRAALLQPILEQDRLIRAYNARRRAAPDIDPDALPAPGELPDSSSTP
jgi:hypothetical protein